jgi:hypothetical protein
MISFTQRDILIWSLIAVENQVSSDFYSSKKKNSSKKKKVSSDFLNNLSLSKLSLRKKGKFFEFDLHFLKNQSKFQNQPKNQTCFKI